MKKIGSLVLSSILGISILSGCGNQAVNNLPLQEITPQQTVSAQSTQGLNAFIDTSLNRIFYVIDKNKDGFITYLEFAPQYSQPVPLPPEPVTPPSAPSIQSGIVSAASVQPLPDDKARFAKLDFNRDGKLSLAEAKKNPRYFMGLDKTQFRKSVKVSFDNLNTDKSTSISMQEFSVMFAGAPYNLKISFTSLFYASDVNKNGSLTFSEYEDAFYAYLQAGMSTPYEQPYPISSAMPVEDPGGYPDPGYNDLPQPVYGEPTPGYGGNPAPVYGNQPLPVEPTKK